MAGTHRFDVVIQGALELDHIAFGRSYHRFVEAVYRGQSAVEPEVWTRA